MMKTKRNVLILSAGRRVALSRSLKAVCDKYGSSLFAADMNPENSSACQDNQLSVKLPPVSSNLFSQKLEKVCKENDIGLVVPTIDTELLILSSLREHFATFGTNIVVSDSDLVSIANNKNMTAEFFSSLGVECPKIFQLDSPVFPAIAKPFDGSLSRDIHVLRTKKDYSSSIKSIPNLMLSEYLDPSLFEEFTCDAYYDRYHNLKCIVPRLRLEVRAGEVSKGKTVKNNIIDLFFEKLSKLFGARGCLTFQFFRNRENGSIKLIELNARFGGGVPLTIAAGAEYPCWLYREWVLGERIEKFDSWEDELTMLRYDDAIFVRRK